MQDIDILEDRLIRKRLTDQIAVLEKVRKLSLMPGDVFATVDMVATYFEVGTKAVQSVVFDHREELQESGMRYLQGEELISFKEMGCIPRNTARLTVLPTTAILRLGMLLRDSEVARALRRELLRIVARANAATARESERLPVTPPEIFEAISKAIWPRMLLGKSLGLTVGQARLLALEDTEREFRVDLSVWKREAEALERASRVREITPRLPTRPDGFARSQ